MLNLCFLDTESQRVSQDFLDGWGEELKHWDSSGRSVGTSNILKMQLGAACTFDNDGMQLWSDPIELFMYLISPTVDRIVTFNGNRFDFSLILGDLVPDAYTNSALSLDFQEGYQALENKSIDVLVEVEKSLGHRVKLDQITSALFDRTKQVDTVQWWSYFTSPDHVKRLQAVNYLIADAMQLYKVYGVGHELGELAYRDTLGNTQRFAVKLPTSVC